MKRLLTLAATLLLTVAAFTATAKDYVIYDVNRLPAPARTCLKENFKNVKVNHINVDKDAFGIEGYDVVLDNGTEIEFDKKGNLKEVETGRSTSVPAGVILQPIRKYVAENFPKEKITKLEVNRNNYEIVLSNGLELKFDRNGQFKRVDY